MKHHHPGAAGIRFLPTLIIGLMTAAAIVVVALFAWNSSLASNRETVAKSNLALAKSVCKAARKLRNDQQNTGADLVLERLREVWKLTEVSHANAFMSVVGPAGKLDWHSSNPEMKGSDVGAMVVSDNSGQTLMQLLKDRKSWSGQNMGFRGMHELVAYYYEPSLNSLVAVHIPAKTVDRAFRKSVIPWLASMAVIGGLLLPCSLGSLYHISQKSLKATRTHLSKLEDSEQRYQSLVDHAPFGVHEIDLNGRLTSMNAAGLAMMGLTDSAEICELQYRDVVGKQDKLRITGFMDRTYHGMTCRFSFQNESGQTFESCFVPLKDRQGRVYKIFGITCDITERLRADTKVTESEALYRTIFEQAAVGVAQLDSNSGELLRVNRRYCEILGSPAESLLGHTWMELTPPEDLEIDLQNMERLRQGDVNDFSIEKRLHRLDGTTVEINLTVSPMWKPGEKPSTHIAIVEDITERSTAISKLKLSETRYRSLVTSAAATVWTTDPHGAFTVPQPMWEEFTGQSPKEHLHFGWTKVIHPEEVDRVLADWTKAIRAPSTLLTEARIYDSRSREYRYCELRATPMLDDKGFVSEWVGTAINITERRNSELALRHSETRYRSLVTSSAATVWSTDANGEFVSPQPMWEAYTGQPWQEHRGLGWCKMLHPDDAEKIKIDWAEAIRSSAPYFGEGRVYHLSSDEYRFFEVRATPIFAADGSVCEWVGTTTDIHDRKLAEVKLRQQHETTDRLLATMLEGFVLMDANGNIKDANSAYCNMVNYDLDLLLKMNIRELEDSLTTEEIDSRVSRTSEDSRLRLETVHVAANGSQIDLEVSMARLHDSDPQFPLIAMFVRDISDRKRAEQQLRLTNFAVDTCSTPIFWIRSDASFLYVNTAVTKHLNYSRDEMMGMCVHDIDPAFPPNKWKEFWSGIREEKTQRFESQIRHKNGNLIPVEITTNHLAFEGREYLFAFVTDLTSRKEAEGKIQRIQEEIAHVSRVNTIAEMAAGIAHELNQPLSAIANYSSACRNRLFESEPDEKNDVYEYLTLISEMAHESGQVIRGVREFTRGKKPEPIPTGIAEVIRSTFEMLRFDLRDSDISVELDLPEPDVIVTLDPVGIRQVLINLVRNAIEAMLLLPVGERTLNVVVAPFTNSIQIQVKDKGTGIPPHQLDHLFEPFFSGKPDGSGIGLSISSRIVKAHRGTLDAWNNEDSGSTFQFTLPAEPSYSI